MINTIGDSNIRLNTSNHNNSSQAKDGSSQINISLSQTTQECEVFESGSLLTDMLTREFNEVFEFSGDKRDLFLKKLNHILLNNQR